MIDRLTADDFRPHLQAAFRVDGPGGPVDLVLVDVEALAPNAVPAAAQRPGFWIHLIGPGGPDYLRQGTFTVHHPVLGPMDIFLVPLGPHDGGMRYEAIFN
jgi:hypothetical protein